MPKRAKTPELIDDAKYLTVVNPYPAHPNMELEQHRKEFARWIAACTQDPLYFRAFYHKPTSPGSVIVEIDETFPDFKRLLGAHKWSEFLIDPRDEAKFVSKMYYCTYNSDRVVQKNGWKRIDVQDKWFKSKAASKFVSPYPATHWCNLPPVKDVIHNSLCRPLPRNDFPPPPPEPMPVVGTPEWQVWRQRQDAPRPVTAWTRGVPPVLVPPAATRTASNSSTASDAGSRASSATRTLSRDAWNNATAPLTPPGLPPGITRGGSSSGSSQYSAGSGSAWGAPPSHRSNSPLETPTSSGSASGDDVPPATPAESAPNGTVMVAGDRIERAFAELSMDDGEDYYYSVCGGSVGGDGDEAGDVGPVGPAVDFDFASMPRASDVFVQKSEDGPSSKGPSPKDAELDEDDDQYDSDGPNDNPEICPEHNVVCRKGICRVAAARDREKKREERRQALEKERAEAQARREKNAKKKGKNSFFKSAPSGSGSVSPAPSASMRQPPPHLRAGAPASAARAPPAHLKTGAPPPPPGSGSSTRQMPPHLQRNASASSGPGPISPPPAGDGDGRLTPTPSRRMENDARSEGSGWGNLSEGPWGAPVKITKGKGRLKAPTTAHAARPPAPAAERAYGAWGRAPSISASSVRRNKDSWSVAGSEAPPAGDDAPDDRAGGMTSGAPRRDWGAWGKAPSISASSVRRNNESWSVSAPSEADDVNHERAQPPNASQREWGAWGKPPSISASSVRRNNASWSVSARSVVADGDGGGDDARSTVSAREMDNWGRPPSVAGSAGAPRGSWADQMDEEDERNMDAAKAATAARAAEDDDVRSVAASTESGWGSVSAGPW